MIITEPRVDLEGLELPVHYNPLSKKFTCTYVNEDEVVDVNGVSRLLERAGRTCYKSEGNISKDSHKAFTKMILSRNHMSVTEHSAATFRIVCDRGVSHELVRHRLAAYAQESTRYCNYMKGKFGGEISVIQPVGLNWKQEIVWRWAMMACERAYRVLLRAGAAPQTARSVLPNSLKTEVVMTANLREWRHVMLMRTSPAAHPDMKIIADKLYEVLVEIAPDIFKKPLSREEVLLDAMMKLSFNSVDDTRCVCCYGNSESGHHRGCTVGEALGERMMAA